MLQYYFNQTKITLAQAVKIDRRILETRKEFFNRLSRHDNSCIGIPLGKEPDCNYLGITLVK